MRRFSWLPVLLILLLSACVRETARPEIRTVTPSQATVGETTLLRLDGANFQIRGQNLIDIGDARQLTITVCGAPLENVRFLDPRRSNLPLVPFQFVAGRMATAVTGTLGLGSQPGVSDIVMVTPHITEPAVLRDGFECLEATVPAATITVNPATASLLAGHSMQFSATVQNAADDTVVWSASAGSLDDANANPVQFTAPAAAGAVTLTASLAAQPEVSAEATITVTVPAPPPVTVTVSPESVELYATQQQEFTATVTGATDTGVTWSVDPAVPLSVNGNRVTFTAPDDGSAQTYQLTATSAADPASSATATAEVLQFPLLLNPSHWIMNPGTSFTFESWVDGVRDDDVNWSTSGGTLTANGSRAEFTAPMTSGDFTITLTSPKYPGLSATSTVEVVSMLASLSIDTGFCPDGLAANDGGLMLIGTAVCGDGDVVVLDVTTGVSSGDRWAGLRSGGGIVVDPLHPAGGSYSFFGLTVQAGPAAGCLIGLKGQYIADSQHVPVPSYPKFCDNFTGPSPVVDMYMSTIGTYYNVANGPAFDGSGIPQIYFGRVTPTGETWLELRHPGNDYATAVSAVSETNAVVAGYSDGDFPPYLNSGGTDALVHSVSQVGFERWSILIGTSGDDRATELTADLNDDIVVGGYLNPSPGLNELFIAKLDGDDGSELWRTSLGPTGDVGVTGLVTDSSGNVYAAGQHKGGTELWAFVAKLAQDGRLLWLELFAEGTVDVTDMALWNGDQLVVAGVTDASGYFVAYFNQD